MKRKRYNLFGILSIHSECEDMSQSSLSKDSSTGQDKFLDFTVIIGDVSFPCQRTLLHSQSRFFQRLFSSDNEGNNKSVYNITEITPDTFESILQAMHDVGGAVNESNMLEMWQAARYLEMEDLTAKCEAYVTDHINRDNVFLVYRYCKISPKVENCVLQYVAKNLNSVADSESFHLLRFEDVLNILRHGDLAVSVDDQTTSILKWCDFKARVKRGDTSFREEDNYNLQYLGNLIKSVDLTKASRECLASLMTNEMVLADQTAVREVNQQAVIHVSESSRSLPMSLQKRLVHEVGNHFAFSVSILLMVNSLIVVCASVLIQKFGWFAPKDDSQCFNPDSNFYTASVCFVTRLWPFT